MNCLESNQIRAWAMERAIEVGDGAELLLPDLAPTLRGTYAQGSRSGREGNEARSLIAAPEPWDECLVEITLTGVWASGEDWPRFYAWRGGFEERRSLKTAPGHVFTAAENTELASLVTMIMENAWDARLLFSRGGRADGARAFISHDEWYEILGGVKRSNQDAG